MTVDEVELVFQAVRISGRELASDVQCCSELRKRLVVAAELHVDVAELVHSHGKIAFCFGAFAVTIGPFARDLQHLLVRSECRIERSAGQL